LTIDESKTKYERAARLRQRGSAMKRLVRTSWAPGRSAFRGVAWIGSALAWTAAAAIAAVLTIFFAATMVVIAIMATGFLGVTAIALRAHRTVRARASDPDLIEARNVGGHSWVAYGWDGRS
jgi:hypothetical protein